MKLKLTGKVCNVCKKNPAVVGPRGGTNRCATCIKYHINKYRQNKKNPEFVRKCRTYSKETNDTLKRLNLCVSCQVNEANKGVRCRACADKQTAANKKRVRRLIKARLCSSCGKNPPNPGRRNCYQCAARYAVYNNRRRQKVLDSGKCGRCFTRPVIEGLRYCQYCKDQCKNYRKPKLNVI